MGLGYYGLNFYGGGSSELPPLPPPFAVHRPVNPHQHYLPPRMNLGTIPPPYVPPYLHLPSNLNHVPLYCNGGLWDREIMPIWFDEDSSLPTSSVCSGPLVGQNPSSMPVNSMHAPVASSSVLPETDRCVPSMNLVNCMTNQSDFLDKPSASMTEMYKENFGISFADVGPDAVKKALDSIDSVIAGEKFSESSDHRNPNVELPCLKGASASYDSPHQSSVPVSVQLGKKPVIDDDSNRKERKLFPMKFSDVVKLPPRKPGEIKMTAQNGNVGDGPVSILSSGDRKTISGKEPVSILSSGDRKTISGKEPVSILSSGDRKTISGKEPVSGFCTSLLIDAMHNLSKLLLCHCSNGTCELSEQDGKSLEQVICNLDKCISTNIGQELYSDLRQVDAIDAPSQKPEEKRKQSDEKDEKISSSVSVKIGSDTGVKMDNKAQDVAFYLASFHKMRIEMEKSLSEDETDFSTDTSDEDEKLSSSDEKLTAVADSGSESDPSVSFQDSVSTIDSDEDSSPELDEVDKLATEANDSSISSQTPQDMLANDAEERSDIKDLNLCSQHDGTTVSPGITSHDDGFSESWSDDDSSDWEHVSMEDLSGLNSSS